MELLRCLGGGGGGGTEVLAAAGGAALGAGAVASGFYLKGLVNSYKDATHCLQFQVVQEALQQSLGLEKMQLPSSFQAEDEVWPTKQPLLTSAAYPQVRTAFETILKYQTARKAKADPKTLVCELLKTWLREHAADTAPAPQEVEAYRNFCSKLMVQKDRWRGRSWIPQGTFVKMLAEVAHELDKLLRVRLRDAKDARRLFEDLGRLSYNLALQTTKVLLLSGTNFSIPEAIYSLNSLGDLNRYSKPVALLKHKADKDVAKEMQEAWMTEAGGLLRQLLAQAHVANIMTLLEPVEDRILDSSSLTVEVLRASSLPNAPGIDIVDPFVRVSLYHGTTEVSSAKTFWLKDQNNPEWNQAILFDFPRDTGTTEPLRLKMEVGDYNGGSMVNSMFARSEPLPVESFLAATTPEEEVELDLLSTCMPARDMSSWSAFAARARGLSALLASASEAQHGPTPPEKCIENEWNSEGRLSRISLEGLSTRHGKRGFRFESLVPIWAEAVQELDDALYFLDICAVQAAELTRLMGDLGAVLLGKTLCHLLDEVDHRMAACAQKLREFADAVVREEIEHHRTRKSGVSEIAEAALRRFSGASDSRAREEANRSMVELRKVEEQIRQVSSQLRKHCLRYQGIKEAKETAENAAAALWRRLTSEETQRRSGKTFGKMTLADVSTISTTRELVDPSPSTAPTAGYVSGDKVHIWSNSQGMWCTDGVVKQVLGEESPMMGYMLPAGSVQVMSDGGMDFSPLCEQQGCTFKLCPPANDRWHPWPFFRRLYDAAESLNTEYVIMLEPDNTIHGPIKREPKHDAGGIYVQDRSFGLVDYVEKLAQARVPGFKWSRKAMSAGLAGGAYFRKEAILDALSDENMMKLEAWWLGEQATKEIYSSDFAMQYAFAARGWHIEPWEETAQMDKNKDIPLTGPKDASFRHYCSCYPGGKPTYNIKLKKEDEKLVRQQPEKYQQTNSVCQLCRGPGT
ncbi:ppiA [Symbiodinium microadriaticum]|nr:ppiA [Symbiodinium microadriaticum]